MTRYAYNPSGDMERITYADGRSVAFTYNALRQLIRIQDWLGITSIEPDPAGRTRKVTDSRGREISYRWGSMGEREMVTYPDGRSVFYEYDELSRLSDGEQEVKYAYDQEGRLSEKLYPDHIRTSYCYNPMGYLESLVHQKDGSILERYEYEYDLSGNRTAIRRDRGVSPLVSDGIPAEVKEQVYRDNGLYQYHYDNLDRLTEVRKDGVCIRQYEYDAFGNRVRKMEEGQQTHYVYNAADQLIREEGDRQSERTYQYDARGNLTAVFHGTSLVHQYAYDETNRLSMAMNAEGRLARYQYNGLGHRTGIQEYALSGAIPGTLFPADPISDMNPVREVDYLLDLTRQYHNLLARTERDKRGEFVQSYLWDANVVLLKEEKDTHIYLQDELGSPVRLVQSGGKRQALYGYDEFGNDRYGNQGEMQPFGYTGYQRDRIAGSYFAQAREYLPEVGRFAGEDILKRNIRKIMSSNKYLYCLENPLKYWDLNGMNEYIIEAQKFAWELMAKKFQQYVEGFCDFINPVKRINDFIDDKHYNRNKIQEAVFNRIWTEEDIHTEAEFITYILKASQENVNEKKKEHWEQKSDYQNRYHRSATEEQTTEEAALNKKFVFIQEDGSSCEVIICLKNEDNNYEGSYIVIAPENAGTYNYSDSGNIFLHTVYDVIPYWFLKNSTDDSSSLFERIFGSSGKCDSSE